MLLEFKLEIHQREHCACVTFELISTRARVSGFQRKAAKGREGERKERNVNDEY